GVPGRRGMSRTGDELETDCEQPGHHLIWTRPSRRSPFLLRSLSSSLVPAEFTIRDRYIQRSAKRARAHTGSTADQRTRGADRCLLVGGPDDIRCSRSVSDCRSPIRSALWLVCSQL